MGQQVEEPGQVIGGGQVQRARSVQCAPASAADQGGPIAAASSRWMRPQGKSGGPGRA